jgi:cyclopropane-fatty-acyl-phospholipid synthase
MASVRIFPYLGYVLELNRTLDYARTLREWARRFNQNFTGKEVKAMQERYPMLKDPKNLEAFRRKWLYMFVYAEVGFARAYTSVHYFTFARPESIAEYCG